MNFHNDVYNCCVNSAIGFGLQRARLIRYISLLVIVLVSSIESRKGVVQAGDVADWTLRAAAAGSGGGGSPAIFVGVMIITKLSLFFV